MGCWGVVGMGEVREAARPVDLPRGGNREEAPRWQRGDVRALYG